MHDRATIELLVQRYFDALRSLIRHCRSRETVSYTPSDFPLTQLDQRQLDNVLAKVSKAKGR